MSEESTDNKPGRRKYTMSAAAKQQRQDAAQHSTGPVTDEGKAASSRNAYKHGMYSQAAELIRTNWMVGAFAKPCRTTCQYHPENNPQYPCTLVIEGLTKAGGDCLDKTVYVQAFDRILTSMTEGKVDAMHEVLAAEAAGALELLKNLRDEIADRGFSLEIPAISKEGDVVYDREGHKVVGKIIGNPAIPHYIKLLDAIGINLPELMATPRAVKDVDNASDAKDAVAALLGGAFGRLSKGRTINQPGGKK